MSGFDDGYPCEGGCGTTFETLADMVPLPRLGGQGVRLYCEDCADTMRGRAAFRRGGGA